MVPYTYSIVSKTPCDSNQSGKKGTAEIYPQIAPGQKIDVTLDYKLKVKEAYDEKFMAKLAELFSPVSYDQSPDETNGQCEADATKAFEETRSQLDQKAGKIFLSTELGDLALQIALCKTQDPDVKRVITNELMANNLYVSFITMGQKTTAEIIQGILYDAGKIATAEKAFNTLKGIGPEGIMGILQKTMNELTAQDKSLIKAVLRGKEYLFKGISQAVGLSIEICEENKVCTAHSAYTDIFGDGTVELNRLISGTAYTVKFRLEGNENKYATLQTIKMKITSGIPKPDKSIPKPDKSDFETTQKVILGDFKACNFDNSNDAIDVNDIRKFRSIITSSQERSYADIDGRGNFDINDVKQCLFRGTAMEAFGLAGLQQTQSGGGGTAPSTTNDALTPTTKQSVEPAWIKVMDATCGAEPVCSESAACSEGVAFQYGCQDGVQQVTSSQVCGWGCDGIKCCTSDRCRTNYNVGQKCQDSDGGKAPNVKGEVTLVGTLNLVYSDQCSGLHAVAEYACDAAGKQKQTVIPCGADEVCSQSACTPLSKTPPQGGNEICGNGIDDNRDSLADRNNR